MLIEPCGIYLGCRRSRSQSRPFCRDSLKRVNSGDLWMFTDCRDVVDMVTVTREHRRLFMYIENLHMMMSCSPLHICLDVWMNLESTSGLVMSKLWIYLY
jgi:hypothetical protein